MTEFQFVKATKKQAKARIAIDGPSGSGKTYTSLIAATALAKGGKIAVIDTERGSASLYSEKFDFDVLELNPPYSPDVYRDAIKAAENAGYAVIVIDSLSHAWEGEGGALDMADDATKRQKTQNSYTAWREVTPVHRAMVDAILQSKCHVVVTMRSKMEYVQEKNSDGRTVINKVGMAPIQRSGMEYEFTIVGDMDLDNSIVISKSRFEPFSGRVQKKPSIEFFKPFVDWLSSGEAKEPITTAVPKRTPRIEAETEPKTVVEKPTTKTEVVNETMTIEVAYKITNSENEMYGELPTETLDNMQTGINKALRKNSLTDEERATYKRKLQAIGVILKARANKEIN